MALLATPGMLLYNLPWLDTRAPQVCEFLGKLALVPEIDVRASPDGETIESVSVDGVSSEPMRASIIPESAETVWVLGVGDGTVIERLLARPSLKKLVVVPIASRSFLALMATRALDWMKDFRVELKAPTEIDLASIDGPRTISPTCLRLAEPTRLKEQLDSEAKTS